MASFDEIVSKMTAAIKGVREAVLGKDVREFIASGYESVLDAYKQLNTAVDSAANSAEEAKTAITDAIDPTLTLSGKAADAKETGDKVGELKEDLSKCLFFSDTRTVRPDNYTTILPDTKQAAINSIYNIIYLPEAMSSMDMPNDLTNKQHECILITYGDITKVGRNQVLIDTKYNRTYTRTNDSGAIQKWVLPNSGITYTVNNGDNLLEVLEKATKGMNNTVIVNDGVYDFIAETLKLYGKDFIENYTELNTFRGAILKNNVTVKCSRGAIIKAEYTGTNNAFRRRFSPLNSGEHGFTLINATVISSNVKYTFHDERSSYTDVYFNNFINCNFKHTKAEESQVIGGGFGKYGSVIIDSCIFESVGVAPTIGIVSYHNSYVADAISSIVIKNSVFKTGTVRISYYGNSTLVTEAKVTNNVLKSKPFVRQENSDYSNVNVSLIAWNNVIE